MSDRITSILLLLFKPPALQRRVWICEALTQKVSGGNLKYLKNEWLNTKCNNDELLKQRLSHLLFVGLLPVIQEKQCSGQEKHAPQDDDEGTEHEGIA